jgi:hypothetical protein
VGIHVDTPRSRLKALQAVARMLLESNDLQEPVNGGWVKKSGHIGNDFTPDECHTVAHIINALKPYVPPRRPRTTGTGTEKSIAHVCLRAPLVILANCVLRACGYPAFCRSIAPSVAVGGVYALPLSATSIYEIFGSRSANFDIRDSQNQILTDAKKAVTPKENKRAVFASLFDITRIEDECQRHGLHFAQRQVFFV